MTHVVLTGELHVGKTTVCRAVVDLARERGHSVRGILTTTVMDEAGQRLGFRLLNLATAEQRDLARLDRDYGGPTPKRGDAVPSVGPFHFDPEVLQWGYDIVAQAIATGCDLLVVDEIGRLELEQNTGFSRVLDLLATEGVRSDPAGRGTAGVQRMAGHHLLVVRRSLLPALRQRLAALEFVTFEVTVGNRDNLASQIVERLFPCLALDASAQGD